MSTDPPRARGGQPRISVLVLDVDGVVTDGRTQLSDGEEVKAVHFHDLDAVASARRRGLTVAMVTKEDTPAARRVIERVGADVSVTGAADKEAALRSLARQLDVTLAEICYVGDADRDAPALAVAGLGLAPADATPTARAAADLCLRRRGGLGAVAEAVELLEHLVTEPAVHKRVKDLLDETLARHRQLVEQCADQLAQAADALVRTVRTGGRVWLLSSSPVAQHATREVDDRSRALPFVAVSPTRAPSLIGPLDALVSFGGDGDGPAIAAARGRGAVSVAFDEASGAELVVPVPAQDTLGHQELVLIAWTALTRVLVEAKDPFL